jgi:hypothetical protein
MGLPANIASLLDVPPELRVEQIVINNGRFDGQGNGTFIIDPGVTLVVRGTIALTNADGTPKLNALGQPTYQDTGWVGTMSLGASQLSSFMSLWEQLQAAAYQQLQAGLASVKMQNLG